MNPQKFFAGLGFISVSLVVHGSVFFSMDRALSLHQITMIREQRRIEREKEGPLQLEFVESPRKASHVKPIHAKRISDKDALNQDLLASRTQTAVRPNTRLQSRADQLAQQQTRFSQAPSPQVNPKEAVPAREEESKNQKEESKNEEARLSDRQAISLGTAEMAVPRPPKEMADQAHNYEKRDSQPARPQVKQKSEIHGLGGIDRITTQEMSKIKSPGAQLFGQTSFEATGSGMGEYMKNLKERIWLAWFPYLAYQYPQDFRGADAVVSLTLDSQGKVMIVQLVDSVGSPVFASYCMEAIQRASGFGPVPKEILELIGKDELEIKFGFHYR